MEPRLKSEHVGPIVCFNAGMLWDSKTSEFQTEGATSLHARRTSSLWVRGATIVRCECNIMQYNHMWKMKKNNNNRSVRFEIVRSSSDIRLYPENRNQPFFAYARTPD